MVNIFGNNRKGLGEILNRSVPAQRGVMEKEVTVDATKVRSKIKTLENAGYRVLGVSHGDTKRKKIWFIIRDGF